MKLIKQSYEILGTPKSLYEAWEFVAKAARNCYQSTKSKPDESEEQFCRRVLLKGEDITKMTKEEMEKFHLSPFEFGIIYLTMPAETVLPISANNWYKYSQDKYSTNPISDGKGNALITTNLRVILENHWEDDLKYAGPPSKHHELACCFKFDTSIHVYKDLTRHEGALSFAIESTRYCRYTSPKFGSGLTFIWHPKLAKYTAEELHLNEDGIFNGVWDGLPREVVLLFRGFLTDEHVYKSLIQECGWTAQDAATKLPQDTKATVFMCGYEDNLQHMFRLRAEECSGPVLPQVAEIMKPMYESYKEWKSMN